jgi:signal transduction histidine kinase
VAVTLSVSGGRAVLVVADSGPGTARITPGGGLAGLQGRLGAVGGSMDVASTVGSGTRVTVTLPVA